jgi:hypothetical protein
VTALPDDVAAVASLLAEGAEVDARTSHGFVPLHLAAFFDARRRPAGVSPGPPLRDHHRFLALQRRKTGGDHGRGRVAATPRPGPPR